MSQTFTKESRFRGDAAAMRAWTRRPGAQERLVPSFHRRMSTAYTPGLEVGTRLSYRLQTALGSQEVVQEFVASRSSTQVTMRMISGPFAKWVNINDIRDDGHGGVVVTDTVEYDGARGSFGKLFSGAHLKNEMERAYAYRHHILKLDADRHARWQAEPRRAIAIAGASGLIGRALSAFLMAGGHTVRAIRRNGNLPDVHDLDGVDVVINLAGVGIADERWTSERKALLIESRVAYTNALVSAMRAAHVPPRLLLQGSAVGVYGDRGDEVLTESSSAGSVESHGAGFLVGLCTSWEAAGRAAESAATRVVLLRTGLVQSAQGGALARLLLPFKVGAGGPIGDGRQWQSWVALEDVIGAIHHAMWESKVSGPMNVVAPNPVTSHTYGRTLARVLGRPAVMPMPAFALRAAFGELADGALLVSQRVAPAALEAAGFTFAFPGLDSALRFTLGR